MSLMRLKIKMLQAMKLIAITKPYCENDEAAFIRRLLESGFDIVHLRKPEADINYCRALLEKLTEEERKKIIVMTIIFYMKNIL